MKRACLAAGAIALPAGLGKFALAYANPASPDLQYHPQYREKLPLEAVLRNTRAGLDGFIAEKYHDQIAEILAQWSANLLRSPHAAMLEGAFAAEFSGSSLSAAESRILRPGPPVEVRAGIFSHAMLEREAFLHSWLQSFGPFREILTAELKITRIDVISSTKGALSKSVNTRIRYEFVGRGDGFYCEQRIGEWDVEWEYASGRFLVRRFRVLSETRSRSAAPVFVDRSSAAFGANASYAAQLQSGVDHWRSVLDVACGIDIYGHNGVSVGDINGNGFDDVYVCQPAGLPNRLYRNRGDGTFEDITEGSGVGLMENTACALFADVDNDGHQELIVVCSDGPQLFLNNGNGVFREKANAFHFAKSPQGTFTGAAIADYDRDGYLDIYFCLYLYYQGTDQYKYPSPYFDAENGPPNFLMKNNRDGTFRDVTGEARMNVNNTRYSFCCGWSDFNGDGWPDLYVVNDFGRKNLYRNHGDGTFTDIAPSAGVEDVGAGMSVCAFDYDNDGNEDLYVANMWTAAGQRLTQQEVFQKVAPEDVRSQYRKHSMGNSLFRNLENGKFEAAGESASVRIGRWAWSSDSWDFDHDGFSDLYLTNGMVSGPERDDLDSFFWRQVVANSPSEAKSSAEYEQGWSALNELLRSDGTWSGYERNIFYANNRDGSFSDISAAAGLDFLEDGRSFALSDFNQDGRMEVILKNRNAPQLRLLQNVIADLPPSIVFRLRGSKSNRDAIGARITVETESGRQTRMLQAGSGFLSQHSKEVLFGLGPGKNTVQATIQWPSGFVQKLSSLPRNHRVWVEEGVEAFRLEKFQLPANAQDTSARAVEPLPTTFGTWLLAPIAAPEIHLPDDSGQLSSLSSLRGRDLLLTFYSQRVEGASRIREIMRGLPSEVASAALNVDAPEGKGVEVGRDAESTNPDSVQDAAAIYNLLYRYLFDRHRDLTLPASFLIDKAGSIVKVYQGDLAAAEVKQDLRSIPRTPADRLLKGLPFPVVARSTEFRRNYLSMGSVFFQRGYYEQAEGFFRAATQDDAESAEAQYGLGSALLKLQKRDEARQSFQRATGLPASYPDTLANAWNNLGLLATQEGRTPESIPAFEEALRLSPGHFIAMVNLGNAYRQQQRWQETRATLKRALAVRPEDPEANYALGMVFAQTENNAQALEYLQRALRTRPDYPEARNNLGVLYLRTGRRDDAVTSFEGCIRVAPDFDRSYLNLAKVYALENDPLKARAVLLELLKRHPEHAQGLAALRELPKL